MRHGDVSEATVDLANARDSLAVSTELPTRRGQLLGRQPSAECSGMHV
jgi:hypothetical protein